MDTPVATAPTEATLSWVERLIEVTAPRSSSIESPIIPMTRLKRLSGVGLFSSGFIRIRALSN